jgi:large subunit ribosomal protein L32
MALPKRKISKARRDKRRSHHAMKPVQTTDCPNCGAPRQPHRACPSCGYYKGTQVVDVETS